MKPNSLDIYLEGLEQSDTDGTGFTAEHFRAAKILEAADDMLDAATRFLAVVQKEMPSEKLSTLNGADQMLRLMEAIAKARGKS